MGARTRFAALALASLALAPAGAVAHVGPSPQTNNRYLTVVAEPGAVRLVYTLIFGDSPGAAARKRMDRDGDGLLSGEEQQAFADSIADVIASGLVIELDGEARDVEWDRVDIGIGSAEVDAGPFSIDLIATFCFEAGGEHAFRVVDGFRVPPVGEGALTIEPSRGVEVLRSAMGDDEGTRRAFKWMGRGEMAEAGHTLVFSSPPASAPPRGCGPEERAEELSEEGGPGRGALAGAAVAVMLAVFFAVGVARRKR